MCLGLDNKCDEYLDNDTALNILEEYYQLQAVVNNPRPTSVGWGLYLLI
jgi:hypothetical protein